MNLLVNLENHIIDPNFLAERYYPLLRTPLIFPNSSSAVLYWFWITLPNLWMTSSSLWICLAYFSSYLQVSSMDLRIECISLILFWDDLIPTCIFPFLSTAFHFVIQGFQYRFEIILVLLSNSLRSSDIASMLCCNHIFLSRNFFFLLSHYYISPLIWWSNSVTILPFLTST